MFTRGWRSIRQAGGRRLAVTALLLVLALLVARFSWNLPEPVFGEDRVTPVLGPAERTLYDARAYRFAPQVDQDARILMVVYDDNTLINSRKRSPLDRGLLARALRNLDTMGARAIGVDILFDQPQDEDPDLIETLRNMRTPTAVAFAEMATNEGDIVYNQEKYLREFLAQLEGSGARPASIRLSDAEGVTRVFPPVEPRLPPTMARVMLQDAGEGERALPGYDGAIRYRLPAFEGTPVFSSVPIDSLALAELAEIPELAESVAELVRGRYVLIGGDIVDYDRIETPFTAAEGTKPPGIEIHATMLAQMLDGARLPQPASWVLWIQALLVVAMAALTALLELRSWKFVPLMLAQALVVVGLPFYLHGQGVDTYGYPAVGPLLGWLIAFVAVLAAARASGAVQRRFAQSALGKYLPRSIAAEIIEKPELLALHGEKKEIFVLFSDLEGFTKLSHDLEPEVVARVLNRYLEKLSQVVLDHDGVIDKFVGDAVVAFWGAPIARPDDGQRAARAAYALWQAGEEFRKDAGEGLPPIGRTRVGLHFGEAVVGNFGGESRIQYTALGDTMNTAARLEAANKALETTVLASREAAERSGLEWWRPMGRIVLRGRMRPVDVFEPAPDFSEGDRAALEEAMRLVGSDNERAIALVAEVANSNPSDAALKNLLRRLRELNEEGSHVLG